MNVWTYWQGPMPDWIAVCIDTMRRRCVRSRFMLLTPENVSGYLEDMRLIPPTILHLRWEKIPPGIGTDALRAALLATHGGLWLDADTVLLRDPAELLDVHNREQFLYCCWPSKPAVCAGYVYAPKDNRIAKQWLATINAHLEYAENVGWMDLGEKMLTPIVNCSTSPKSSWQMPARRFLPLDFSADPNLLVNSGSWRDYCHEETIGFALNHSWLEAHHHELMAQPIEDMAKSPVLVHRLLAENQG